MLEMSCYKSEEYEVRYEGKETVSVIVCPPGVVKRAGDTTDGDQHFILLL